MCNSITPTSKVIFDSHFNYVFNLNLKLNFCCAAQFLMQWLGLSAVPASTRPKFGSIVMLLIGSPVKVGHAAPNYSPAG